MVGNSNAADTQSVRVNMPNVKSLIAIIFVSLVTVRVAGIMILP